MKHIPDRTFRELLRLADTLREAPSHARAQELHAILYAIARQQVAKPRNMRSTLIVNEIGKEEGLVLE